MKTVKRIVILFSIAALLFSMAAMSVAGAKISYVRGDANSDGQVDIRDVTLVQRVLSGLQDDPSGVVGRNCDVDGNGLGITDATCIQRYLAEFTDSYGIGEDVEYEEYELPFIPCN